MTFPLAGPGKSDVSSNDLNHQAASSSTAVVSQRVSITQEQYSKIFFPVCINIAREEKYQEIFYIPHRLSSPKLRESLRKQENFNSEVLGLIRVGELPRAIRLKQVEIANPGARVYEIDTIFQKRKGRYELCFHKGPNNQYPMDRFTFTKIHGAIPEKFLSLSPEIFPANVSQIAINCESQSLRINTTSASRNTKVIAMHHIPATEGMSTVLSSGNTFLSVETYKNTVKELINEFGSQISPNESMELIFDSLAQAIVKRAQISEEDKSKLTCKMLEFFEDVYWRLTQLNNNDTALLTSSILLKKISQIDAITKPFGDESLSRDIKKLMEPWKAVLEYFQTLPENQRKLFDGAFKATFSMRLNDFSDCKVSLSKNKSLLNFWISNRVALIKQYIRFKNPENFIEAVDRLGEVEICLKNGQFAEAYTVLYVTVQSVQDRLLTYARSSTTNVLPIKEFYRYRINQMMMHALDDFKYITAQSKQYQLVSFGAFEEAYNQFHKVQQLQLPVENRALELTKWAQGVSKKGEAQLLTAFKKFKKNLNDLQGVVKTIQSNKEIATDLKKLEGEIQKANQKNIIENYVALSAKLKSSFDDWKKSLLKINSDVREIQGLCFLLALNPSMPEIDISVIQNEFREFNRCLKALIVPFTFFENAFNQMIVFDRKTVKETSANPEIALRLSAAETLTISLFHTKHQEFNEMNAQISALRAKLKEQNNLNFEISVDLENVEETIPEDTNKNEEIPIAASSSEPINTMQDEIAQVFSGTKTRVIMNSLVDFMKKYNVPLVGKFGKGDHFKLYVNGIPFVIPTHKELGMGLKNRIENDLFHALQNAIDRG